MSERRMLELADHNFTQSLREHARWAQGDICESHGGIVLRGATDFPVGPFNALARVHEHHSASLLVDWAHASFAATDRRFSIYARRHADADLEAECQVRRYRECGRLSVMALTRRTAPPREACSAELVRVTTAALFADFVDVARESFETLALPQQVVSATFRSHNCLQAPHLELILARKAGKPVACALSIQAHWVAGVYWVGTVPSQRGQGFATRCVGELTRAAFDRGVDCVVLQARGAACSTYQRLGFRELSELVCYVAPRRQATRRPLAVG